MPIRVAIYCRVSTETEIQQHSLGVQKAYYENYIRAHENFVLAGMYIETASGVSIKKRKQFKAMMRACRKKKIDLIITKSISRFARNALDFLQTIRELKALGVDVISESEQIRLSEERSEFMMAIYAAIMQEESISKSNSTKWGITARFASGDSKLANRICYGYKHDQDGKLIVDVKTSKNVVLIFDLYLRGYSLSGIGKELKRRGIKTPTGKENWTSVAIDKILSNEKYTGNVILQKTYVPDVLEKKQTKNIGQRKRYLYENNHLGFIPKEIFEKVQEEKKRRSNVEFIGTGKLKRKSKRYVSCIKEKK